MTAARLCSECSAPIAHLGPQAKTCSEKCRKARSRRLAEENARAAEPRPDARMQEVVREHATDVAAAQIQKEVGPVVRAAITEDTLAAVRDLVALTPKAIAALTEDLESEDPVIRQRAYTLFMKYTVGHPAIVKPEESDKSRPLNIIIPTPRAEDPAPQIDPAADVTIDGEALKICDMCAAAKPDDQFVDGSDRCRECWEAQQARVAERFADEP